jgi:hypothetical protein
MPGEKNLNILIKNVKPFLHEGRYVFISTRSLPAISAEEIICYFREDEGTTLIIKKSKADELQLSYSFVASWITLRVHSSLEAVGLTARVSAALAEAGISCNAIAGFYHDHIFVPSQIQDKAMNILRKL